MNIARWMIAYGFCALMAGAALAVTGQAISLGCMGLEGCTAGFNFSGVLDQFDALNALKGTLIFLPIVALVGFVPALIIFGLPEAIGIRPSGLRNALISAVFVGTPFLYMYWQMGGNTLAPLLTHQLFLPATMAAVIGGLTLGWLRQGPLCYRKPE